MLGVDQALVPFSSGQADLMHLQGQAYADPGATAYDTIDGAITSIAASGISAVNTMVVSQKLLHVASCTYADDH